MQGVVSRQHQQTQDAIHILNLNMTLCIFDTFIF